MNTFNQKSELKSSFEETHFAEIKQSLLDPLALELANNLQWWHLKGLSKTKEEQYPVVVKGKGSPVLMLHGFDSSFLEFRRLAPFLDAQHQLIIPDLFGFGFCPRPLDGNYGREGLLNHLDKILEQIKSDVSVGLIGASMGGAIAMELARRHPKRISQLLLLAPAGLTGRPMPLPAGIARLGVWFLSRPSVRKGLCRQAFADPEKSVGRPEEQIASLHLGVKGWSRSLASFAQKGGLANCGKPLPKQPFHTIWGANDRILRGNVRKESLELLSPYLEEIENCGHLPHLDHPDIVAKRWLEKSLNK